MLIGLSLLKMYEKEPGYLCLMFLKDRIIFMIITVIWMGMLSVRMDGKVTISR